MTETKSVKGMVYHASSGKPVEGAMIMIAGGDYEHQDIASQSDEQGIFYLPDLQIPGKYSLLIRYRDQSKTIDVDLNRDSVLKIPL